MKRAALALVMSLLGCARGEAPPAPTSGPCAPTATSPLLGCWRVETTTTSKSLPVGMLVQFSDREVLLRGDAFNWGRMPLRWEAPNSDRRLLGTLDSGEELDLQLVEGKLTVMEDGVVLATATRVGGDDAVEAARQISAVPSFARVNEAAKECFAAYGRLRPTDRTFEDVHVENFKTTASARNLVLLAQTNLARDCQPIPESCAQAPMLREDRDALAKKLEACRAGAR